MEKKILAMKFEELHYYLSLMIEVGTHLEYRMVFCFRQIELEDLVAHLVESGHVPYFLSKTSCFFIYIFMR